MRQRFNVIQKIIGDYADVYFSYVCCEMPMRAQYKKLVLF